MRLLSVDIIVQATRTRADEIEFLSLNGQDVEKLADDLHLFSKLDTLSLSRNHIFHGVQSLMGCKQLWNIDLSSNNIKSLEGLQYFAALGSLNLSRNKISTTELPKLKQIPIIKMSLSGNLEIERAYGSNYRRAVAVNLPHIWVLDDQLLEESECDPRSYSMINDQSSWQNGDFSISEIPNQVITSTLAQKHLKLLGREPPINRGRDKFRLRHLARIYDAEATRFNQQVKKMIFGQRPKLLPLNHLKVLETLSRRTRVDLLVGLVAALHWAVPKLVVTEALTVLLTPHISASIASDLAQLSTSATQSLCFVMREQLEDEASSLPGVVDALPSDVRSLLDAVPNVVVPPTYFSSHSQSHSSQSPVSNRDSSGLRVSLARHAAIFFSRAPSCPALTASHHNSRQRKIYDALLPLLSSAVLSSADLDPSASSWADETKKKRRCSSPSVTVISAGITVDEDDLTLDSLALDRDGLIERLGFEGTPPPSNSRFKNVQLSASVEGTEEDTISCSQEESIEQCDLLHARCPKLGERVKMTADSNNLLHLVASVREDRSAFTISPPYRGIELVTRSEVMWDPRCGGWWTHTNAIIERTKRSSSTRKQTLFRTSSPDAVHHSGVSCKASTFNVSLPVLKKAGKSVVSDPPPQLDSTLLETHSTYTRSNGLISPIQTYISLASWDPEFVLAPPQLVEAQNSAAGVLGVDRPWSAIEDHPVVTSVQGRPSQDIPYPLQPRASISGKVLRESLAMLPHEHSTVNQQSINEADLYRVSNSPYTSHDPWEKLQREMGTFLSSHGHKHRDPIDIAFIKNDLLLRRQLKEANLAINETSVFGLTSPPVDMENLEVAPRLKPAIVEESDIDILEGLKELDTMAQTIRGEVEEEIANEMMMKKALVKPWRTLKPQGLVAKGMYTVPPTWQGHKFNRSISPKKAGLEKPAMPVHQLGILPVTKPNLLAGGRRRAKIIHRPTPDGGPSIQKCIISQPLTEPAISDPLLTSSSATKLWSQGNEKPRQAEEVMLTEGDAPISSHKDEAIGVEFEPSKPLPRLVSIIRQRNNVLWKRPTGKQALRDLGFAVR